MSRNAFFSKFFKVVLEQDEEPGFTPAPEEMTDDQALQVDSEVGTDPDALGVEGGINPEDEKLLKYAATRELEMVKGLTEWVNKLDDMVEFLNGTNPDSIQMKLKKAVPDTIFDKMRSSEAKKIARVAKEISALAETFKGYLATADDPKYRFI